ncbi:transcriptional regulator with XRE-family HTH domain [Arthrobacter sp. PL16]|uniref:helix-turn-helix domain-containing protein n=1 Tax=Arthrobacter sp. PL16 TaxID=3071720 RepID=UPI002E0B75A4|nr:transcriptional regulator with XRE-family HTH domain [Arthrobacter sp. PL16]
MSKRKSTDADHVRLPWEAAFAKSLARARMLVPMSQSELARRATEAGLPLFQQQIQRIENLTRPVSLNEAVLLAQILHGDPWDMAAQMVDDDTAHELLRAAQRSAEEAALRTIRTIRDEYYRFDAALIEAKLRLDQFATYRQERWPEALARDDMRLFEWSHERLERTGAIVFSALEPLLTEDDDEPQLAQMPSVAEDE